MTDVLQFPDRHTGVAMDRLCERTVLELSVIEKLKGAAIATEAAQTILLAAATVLAKIAGKERLAQELAGIYAIWDC